MAQARVLARNTFHPGETTSQVMTFCDRGAIHGTETIRLRQVQAHKGEKEMDWDFGDIILTMIAFFFWFTFIWMFIGAFTDVLRRPDLSGWAKAGWIALITILPLLGVLAYMVSRPAPTAEELASTRYAVGGGSSRADEITKLAELHDKGKLTDEEFSRLKAGALS